MFIIPFIIIISFCLTLLIIIQSTTRVESAAQVYNAEETTTTTNAYFGMGQTETYNGMNAVVPTLFIIIIALVVLFIFLQELGGYR